MHPSTSRPALSHGTAAALLVGVASLVVLGQGGRFSLVGAGALSAVALVIFALIRELLRVREEVSALAMSESRFRALIQQSSDVTLILDEVTTILYVSPAAAHVFGRPATSLEGVKMSTLVHSEDAAAMGRFVVAAAAGEASASAEWRVRGAAGVWLWTENTASDLGHEPSVAGVVINCRDISERRTLEARLTHQAFHDPLTRLANRALFRDRVAHAVARAARVRHSTAVLFLDLDDFKKVNDSLGHAAGDELLVACSGRLSSCVRPGDTIARLGGDEFAVLLEDIAGMSDAIQIAERISTAIGTPFRVQERDVVVGVSIGIAEVTIGDSPDEVLRNADLAMYFAKGQDKGRYAIYQGEMHEHVLDRLELEADLRAAVEAGDIRVEYQPIVRLATGKMYGAEALVRWSHPRRGHVSPSHFVKVAEETGLIVPIGRAVLREACTRAREWRQRRRGPRTLRMSVNLSGYHFQEASLLDDVRGALQESGLEPGGLTLEITESILMQRSDATLDKLRALKALGLSLAIDDFGTGYSSLGYLQQFPIDVLKVDRTFVDQIGMQGADPVLARAIISLGKTLRLETIAEGVERPQQRDALRAMGCTLGQGYLFARPMAAEEFAASLLETPLAPSLVEPHGNEPRHSHPVSAPAGHRD